MQKILEEATAEGAAVVAREAQENSRRGGEGGVRVNDDFPMLQTGNLKRSIKPIRKKSSSGFCEIQVGSSMEYAARLEYGYNDKDKKGRQIHQRPRPFLRPALDEHKPEIQKAFDLQIQEFLRLLK